MDSYKLLNFTTESFFFKIYNETKLEKEMIKELENDISTKEFLTDFWNYIMETKLDLESGIQPQRYTNIIYFKSLPIGLITFFDIGNELIFSHGIRPSERGKRFSSRVKKEVIEYVFNNLKEISEIIMYIDKTNTRSLNSLKKSTYDKIETILDKNNQKEFVKITNYNPYYKEFDKKR